MRKKLCLTLCVLTLSVLTACGSTETESAQLESTTEEVVAETTEEAMEEPTEEATEEVVETPVAEPLYNYTEDVAFTVEQHFDVDGIERIDIKTIEGYQITPSDDTVWDTGEPAYYYYKDANGFSYKFDIQYYSRYSNTDNCIVESEIYTDEYGNEVVCDTVTILDNGSGFQENYVIDTQTFVNADGEEITYEYFTYDFGGYWNGYQSLFIPLGIQEDGMDVCIRIAINVGTDESTNLPIRINPEEYSELTRKCYYIIHEAE